jgi:acyl-CoA hydrolase
MQALPPKSPAESEVVMTQMVLPPDANTLGNVFGGRVMEWIDVCGAIAAQRHCRQVVVTASMDDVHFHAPIRLGWTVTLHARVLATFRSSMEVGVRVTAENPRTGERHAATSALITFVTLSAEGERPPVPALRLETEAEKRAFQEAEARRAERLARRSGASGPAWHEVVGPGL